MLRYVEAASSSSAAPAFPLVAASAAEVEVR